MKDSMIRTLSLGFVAGALLGVYGQLFGLTSLAIVLLCGIAGMAVTGGSYVASRIDRTRLVALLGELER